MDRDKSAGRFTAGAAAGAVNGLLGAGGGMVLVPLLTKLGKLEEEEIFPASVGVMLPVCLVSLGFTGFWGELELAESGPWLFGSGAGGLLAGIFGRKIPVKWLHRVLGIFILWGGIRNLW